MNSPPKKKKMSAFEKRQSHNWSKSMDKLQSMLSTLELKVQDVEQDCARFVEEDISDETLQSKVIDLLRKEVPEQLEDAYKSSLSKMYAAEMRKQVNDHNMMLTQPDQYDSLL